MEAHRDSSLLHQRFKGAITYRGGSPRVAAFGFRFGANVAVRLAYLESRLRNGCLWSVVPYPVE